MAQEVNEENNSSSSFDGQETLSQLDESKITPEILEKLRLEQNLPIALLGAIATGIAGAIIWGAITVATNYQIGYMAIAIGAGVGIVMRFLGKGIDQIFGISGAIIAVLSCFLGNFFSVIGFYANEQGIGYIETLQAFDFNYFIPVMKETFNFMDILFYGFAAYEGYKFSFRIITQEDINRLK